MAVYHASPLLYYKHPRKDVGTDLLSQHYYYIEKKDLT